MVPSERSRTHVITFVSGIASTARRASMPSGCQAPYRTSTLPAPTTTLSVFCAGGGMTPVSSRSATRLATPFAAPTICRVSEDRARARRRARSALLICL
jgi:hypothetical protein